jgi:hypothetical protein
MAFLSLREMRRYLQIQTACVYQISSCSNLSFFTLSLHCGAIWSSAQIMNRTACRLRIALYGFFQTSFSTRPPASYRVAPISRYTMISDRSAHTYPWMCPRYEMAKLANRAACVHESQRNIVASSDWQISLGTELLRRTCELGATFEHLVRATTTLASESRAKRQC